MYSLSKEQLAKVLEVRLVEDDSMGARLAEATVQQSLPCIVGLDDAKTENKRNAIYERTIAQQLPAFVSRNGSAFGEVAEQVAGVGKLAPARKMLTRTPNVLAV